MNKRKIFSITGCLIIAAAAAGCSIDEPVRFNGSSCGSDGIEFLGILGNSSLSDIRNPNADQKSRYANYHICPDDYPYCVYSQDGATIDESQGVICSKCAQGQLLCDSDTGGQACTDVLTNKQHCGGCNNPCAGVCVDGKCSVNECGSESISCEVTSGDGSTRNVCVNPLSNETCGASCENPSGTKCSSDRTCQNKECKCKDGLTDCNGECIDLNNTKTCGLTCEDTIECDQSENQYCNQGKCTCPGELIFREGHCIDPMRNNKYCGANDTNSPNGVVCPIENGLVCQDGICRCHGNLLRVPETNNCVDPMTDKQYCGAMDVDGYAMQPYSCFGRQKCVEGKCVCPDGEHKTITDCASNEKTQCNARGNASSDDPKSPDYKGYNCGGDINAENDYFCAFWWPIFMHDDQDSNRIYSYYRDAQFCAAGRKDTQRCKDSKYNLYEGMSCTTADPPGCADPNRVIECTNTCVDNFYVTSCVCKEGLCGRLCEEVLNDNQNCGACGNTCPEHAHCAEVSSEFKCTCDDGYAPKLTNGLMVECIDVKKDRNNCGEVGHACNPNESCVNAECKSCGPTQTLCLDTCLENYDAVSQTDSLGSLEDRHIKSCSVNKLKCADNYGNCNVDTINLFDGCETELLSKENCGSCGNICGNLASCKNGRCCIDNKSEYVENTSGEYRNAACCLDGNFKKCHRVEKYDNTYRNVYSCRTQCNENEVDVTNKD